MIGATRFLRDRIDAKEQLRGLSCAFGEPQIAEEFAMAGFDYVYVDQQHGHVTQERLLQMMRAITPTDTAALVRVAENQPALIGAALDAGAEGVIVPDVEDAGAAARAVRACKYAPLGSRSWGPMRAVHGVGVDPAVVNSRTVCLVMIESKAAVEAIDEILDVPGIDGVYIGPADLSVSLGGEPKSLSQNPDERTLAAIKTIRDACVIRGKIAAVSGRPSELHKEGYAMVTAASDYTLIRSGLQSLQAD
ncbi:HpcH/HpaI aldolase/citrate lyase family protein [Arthrobacter sp. NPDC056727]|uniref:HpcH/HpaI aldolase family protein n=1 Tax=Arthrobacter sp. NPDC056727 TaxID=3345927 RepID=UPI00366DE121